MGKYDYYYKKLGEFVRDKREEAHLSQRQLADMCGLHYNTVYALENGKGKANLETVFRISDGLETNFISLLNDIVQDHPLK